MRTQSLKNYKKQFAASYEKQLKLDIRQEKKDNKRVFASDCATKNIVFRNLEDGLYFDDNSLSFGGCGRWDCFPCSVKRARQCIMYMSHAVKDWRNIIMWTFGIRHLEPMDREIFRKVICKAFQATICQITQKSKVYGYNRRNRHGDTSSILNGRYPDMRYIRILERHNNGYLHIHMLTDSFIPWPYLNLKWNNNVETCAARFGLLEGMPQHVLNAWYKEHIWSEISDEYVPKEKLAEAQTHPEFKASYRRFNGNCHCLYPKSRVDSVSTSLQQYVTKMSNHDKIPKMHSTKDYKRNLIAMQLAGYLSKSNDRRQQAVELALKYKYNKLPLIACRYSKVISMSKFLQSKKTGLWKIIGYGAPGKDVREEFYPTASALAEGLVPEALYTGIAEQTKAMGSTLFKHKIPKEFAEWVKSSEI